MRMLEEYVAAGVSRPHMVTYPIQKEADYDTYAWIVEHAEIVPRFEQFALRDTAAGENGYVVPLIERVPFQHLMLDMIGEVNLFYALYDNPRPFERLMEVMDAHTINKLEKLAELDVPYVEFFDNLDGMLTNPKLFTKYVLPAYQRYSDLLHGQNKKMGCHGDGNLKKLLKLLPESGLDVCESFTPAPMTDCSLSETLDVWQHGPLIWGGFPQCWLEETTSEAQFQAHFEGLMSTVKGRPFILGIGDAVMGNNIVGRLKYMAERINR
jgi:hypothetical protein